MEDITLLQVISFCSVCHTRPLETLVKFDDNGSVWAWTSSNCAHQMYKIERELCRQINTTNFSHQMDDIDMVKSEPCIVQHNSDRWARAEIVDMRTSVTGQQEIEVSLWDLGGTDIVPEYKCSPMPDSLRDIPRLANQLFLDNVVPNTYHFPGVSWSECALNEMYRLTGLPSESGPVPLKAEILLNSKVILHVVSEETNQLVNFNQHLIEQGLGNNKSDDRAELVKNISNEVYLEIPMKETIPIVRSLMFSKFPNSICKKLNGLGFHSPTVIQQYGWPYLMAGHSCLLVSPSRTGKTLTYLLPLLSHLLMLNTVKKSHWPPAVVVTSSTQEAIRLNAIAQRILSWQTAHYRCCCYYHGNEADVIVQLLNGCMLLVTTLPLLLQLLRANHFKLTELQILVVDECDKVVSGGHEMEELMGYWSRHRDNCGGYEKQLVMACSKATQDLHKFVTSYMKGSVKLIACAIEAVIWSEVPMVVKCCHDDNLDSTLLEQLNGFSECGNIMVTTNSALKSKLVTELLQQNSWPVTNLDHPLTAINQATIFVTTTERLLSVTAVQLPVVNHLILYMLANTKSEFKRTLATLYPAIKAKLKCSITLLLAGDYKTQVVTIATMLNSMQVPLPPSLDDLLKKELELREQSASELCCDIKAWGSCKKLGCNYVHNVSHDTNTHMIPPHKKLPSSGTVKFKVDHVTSAGQYWARLKEHIPIKFGDEPDTYQPSTQLVQLYTELAQYYADGKVSAQKNIAVEHCYGFCDAEKVCHRVQVLQLSEPLDGTMYFHKEKARVQLIDVGLTRIVDINQLWHLPEHFKTIPRQVVEIFMYGVKPAAGNGSWSGEADKLAYNYFYGKLLHGNIVFSHGNTLWLDTIEERVELKNVDVITPLSSLRGQLLQLGLAETNTGHLAQLKQATSDVSNTTSITEPSYSELPLDEEFIDVYLSAVITPELFYVQRVDELDSIDTLVDQLNDHSFPHSVHHSALQLETGLFCVAQFPTDHKWYRGTIQSYNESEKTYNISFVDFGDSANVHRSNVQPIADRLINNHKFYAIQCSLANIKPFGSTWSSVAADELFEHCQDKQLVAKVIRTGTSDDQWLGTHHVILLYDTTGPHDVSMVTMLVEQNLARHCNPDVFIFTMALEGKKPVEQITLLRELQAKMLRHSRTMTLDKQDLSWVLQHLSKFTISVKQEVMSLLAHLTVSQPWLKQWLSEPQQLHPLQVQIQQFCENKFHDSRLWNNFLKMLTTCAAKRKKTDDEVTEDRTEVKEEENVVTEKKETANNTGYDLVYLPETDTSEDEDLYDSDSSNDFDN